MRRGGMRMGWNIKLCLTVSESVRASGETDPEQQQSKTPVRAPLTLQKENQLNLTVSTNGPPLTEKTSVKWCFFHHCKKVRGHSSFTVWGKEESGEGYSFQQEWDQQTSTQRRREEGGLSVPRVWVEPRSLSRHLETDSTEFLFCTKSIRITFTWSKNLCKWSNKFELWNFTKTDTKKEKHFNMYRNFFFAGLQILMIQSDSDSTSGNRTW